MDGAGGGVAYPLPWGPPLWVTLAAVGVFVGKSALEWCLMARYQRQM